jgi:hypothetical protein
MIHLSDLDVTNRYKKNLSKFLRDLVLRKRKVELVKETSPLKSKGSKMQQLFLVSLMRLRHEFGFTELLMCGGTNGRTVAERLVNNALPIVLKLLWCGGTNRKSVAERKL